MNDSKEILQKSNNSSLNRSRKYKINAFIGVAYKIVSLLIPVLTVRFTLNYMGVEIYGLWASVSAMFALLNYADLGLGNGLKTKLPSALCLEDKTVANKLISSTYFILFVCSSFLVIIFLVWIRFADVQGIFNTDISANLIQKVLLIVCIPRILQIPLGITLRTESAFQEDYFGYLWSLVGSLFSIIGIITSVILDLGIDIMLLSSSCFPLLFQYINYWFFFHRHEDKYKPKLKNFNLADFMSLFSIGIQFFILSIVITFSMNMDNYFVGIKLGLTEVAEYSIVLKITQVMNISISMICLPLWTANCDAFARGDIAWVKTTTKKVSFLGSGFVILTSIFFIVFKTLIIKIWLGFDLTIDNNLIIGLCSVQLILAFISPYFMILNSKGLVSFQILIYSVLGIITIPSKLLYFPEKFGMICYPWINIIGLLIICPFIIIYTKKKLNFK